MPMRHQGFVEFHWPGFEHEVHCGTEPSYPFQSEFWQLTGLKGGQGRAANRCLSCKSSEREAFGPALLGDEMANGLQVHESSILEYCPRSLVYRTVFENEQVHIWNIDNSERLVSYAICAARGSGMVPVRGPTGGASLNL